MLIIFSLLLFILSILNYLLARSFLYPPFIFSIFWALLLLVLKFAGNMFYSISYETLFLYFIGAVAFSIGGLVPLLFKHSREKEVTFSEKSKWPEFVINIGLIFSLILLPYYFYYLIRVGLSSGLGNFWMGLKYQLVNNKMILSTPLSRFRAFVGFTSILAYLEYKCGKVTKKKALLIIIIAMIYELSTTQRAGAFRLVFVLLGVKFITERMINYRFLGKMLVLFFFMFIIPAILIGQIQKSSSLIESFSSGMKLVALYGVGGLVAFGKVIANPSFYIGSRITTFRFFSALLNTLGYTKYELPTFNPIFTLTPLPTNTYTFYFSYFMDFGYFGLFMLTFLIGIFSSFIFMRAYYGKNNIFIFLYGLVIAVILVSSMNEIFYTAISYWLQAIIFLLIVYKLPSLFRRREDEKGIRYSNS